MVSRVVVGAHYGLRDWLLQRVSALVMVAYSLFIVGLLIYYYPLQYSHWKSLFQEPWMRGFSFVFLLSLYLHAWVGVRDILMDYVHPAGLRLLLYVMTIVALVSYTVWSMQILWGL